jgi:hypothetical integral membrane protein (TIGR02206 family)
VFSDFFKYWDDLPEDGGFSLFGLTHIGWLIFLTAAIVLSAAGFKKTDTITRCRIIKILAVILFTLELLKDLYLVITGNMQVQYLPLEMCGLAIFIELIYSFSNSKFLGEVMCIICMPGAMAALLFPDWTRYPFFNFMHINSFILHGILVLIPILILSSRMHVPKIKYMWKNVLFLIIVVPIIYVINKCQGTDFMFLMWPSIGSPFMKVYMNYGYAAYMIVYGVTVFGVMCGVYGVLGILKKFAGVNRN